MHSYSLKCQTRPTKTEIPMFLTNRLFVISFFIFYYFFSFFFLLYLNVHTFCAKHCCSPSLSIYIYIAMHSFYKWRSFYQAEGFDGDVTSLSRSNKKNRALSF